MNNDFIKVIGVCAMHKGVLDNHITAIWRNKHHVIFFCFNYRTGSPELEDWRKATPEIREMFLNFDNYAYFIKTIFGNRTVVLKKFYYLPPEREQELQNGTCDAFKEAEALRGEVREMRKSISLLESRLADKELLSTAFLSVAKAVNKLEAEGRL